MLFNHKSVVFNGKKTALPRYYEDKIWNTDELKKERQAEKLAYSVNCPQNPYSNQQREKNLEARVNLKRKGKTFEQSYKDFKESNLLG